jgi:hypothetical protein
MVKKHLRPRHDVNDSEMRGAGRAGLEGKIRAARFFAEIVSWRQPESRQIRIPLRKGASA